MQLCGFNFMLRSFTPNEFLFLVSERLISGWVSCIFWSVSLFIPAFRGTEGNCDYVWKCSFKHHWLSLCLDGDAGLIRIFCGVSCALVFVVILRILIYFIVFSYLVYLLPFVVGALCSSLVLLCSFGAAFYLFDILEISSCRKSVHTLCLGLI